MDLFSLFLLLLIAGVCGFVGQSLAGYTLGGCLVSILVGFVGAWLGVWLARELTWPLLLSVTIDGEVFPLLWSVAGSAVLALGVGWLRRVTEQV